MCVGDDTEPPIDGAVVEVEEALRLAVAHHVAAVRIGARNLGLLRNRLTRLVLERLLAVSSPVIFDRRVQRIPIVRARLGDHREIVAVLVGVGLEMRRVGIEYHAVDQTVADRLLDDGIEDVLRHRRVVVTPAPVLRQRRSIEHRIHQLEPQEPAIGDVDLDLAHQLALGAHPEQVADEQRLEHQRRIERRTAVVRAIKSGNTIVDEGKVDHRLDLAKQMILRNQTVEAHYLQRGLFRQGLLQHALQNHKVPANGEDFVSGLSPPFPAGFEFLREPEAAA